jgi:hypothetical protein
MDGDVCAEAGEGKPTAMNTRVTNSAKSVIPAFISASGMVEAAYFFLVIMEFVISKEHQRLRNLIRFLTCVRNDNISELHFREKY